MAVDADYGSVELLLHLDGANNSTTFTDSSVNARSCSAVGNAKLTTSSPKFGTASAIFDGSGDAITATIPALGTGDFTIEFWVNPTTGSSAAYSRFIQIGPNATAGGLWLARNASANPISFLVDTYNGSSYARALTGSATLASGSWAHVALTRESGVWRLFINGALDVSATFTSTGNNITATGLYVGSNDTAGESLAGQIDELRITRGVARYTAAFTAPTAAFSTDRGGWVSVAGPLGSPSALGAFLVSGISSATGPLGTPAALGKWINAGYVSLPSILQTERVLGIHDFSALIDPAASQSYVMDVTTEDGRVRIPISSWQATLRAAEPSYVQCVVPACEQWVDRIAEATAFDITRRALTVNGDTIDSIVASAPLESTLLAQGALNYSATLSGYGPAIEAPEAVERALTGIRTTFTYSTGYRVRCAIDWILQPGHTATFDDISFPVRYISYYVNENDSFMDVGQ